MDMDKSIIKKYLDKTFLSESDASSTPAIKLANKLNKEQGKINKAGVEEIGKDMKKYEKGLGKTDTNTKTMAQNKFNYNGDMEKKYHDEMEILNGQEMLQYDRKPDEVYTERALEAIEGSSRMGNNADWANVVAKGDGGDPEFGKNLVKRVKDSIKQRSAETPTSKMFGDDWEVVKDKGHKAYAFENTNKNQPQIKESMKRLKFKKTFNGVGNAIKLIPESYKVDKKVFEMTDGNEAYKVRWEGTVSEGKAVILMASDKKMVNEDIQKMKHLMGYKSQETLGTVKGKARIDENQAFSDVYYKTKKLLGEMEDIDGQDAEKEAPFEDADVNQAPEAKKHIEGSTSTDKGTKAPKPKNGEWEKISVPHAAEAKKHIEGSTSDDKGTKAPKPKTGEWEEAVSSQASEAKKDMKSESVKKKALTEDLDAEMGDDEEDVPVKGREDAYDASLDTQDPEEMTPQVEPDAGMNQPPMINKDAVGGDDEEGDDISIPQPQASTPKAKLMRSNVSGKLGIMYKDNGITKVVDVPEHYAEMATQQGPDAVLQAIRKDKMAMYERINKQVSSDLNEAVKKLKNK